MKYERSELDQKIEENAGKALNLAGHGIKNLLLSVPYGIKEAKNYTKSDIGLLTLSLLPTVLIKDYIPIQYCGLSYALTCFSFRGMKFIANKWLFNKAMRECQVMSDNNKYPRLKSIKYEGLRKTYVVNSSIGSSKFKIHAQKLKSTSNICLTEIDQPDKKNILLHTEKKGKIKEEFAEIGKFQEVFESMDLDIKIKDFELSEYFLNIFFDTDIFYNKLQTLIQELTHRLKVDNLEIQTDTKHNYKLTVKKKIKKKLTFLTAWDSEEVQERIKSMFIPVLAGVNVETGKIALYDWAKDMYHTLVAGTSGWGKSVLVQNICSSILLANRDNIKCYFYDTKGTELNLYKGLKNVVFEKEPEQIVKGLEKLVVEMKLRNKKIENNRFIKNIWGWNEENPDDKMDFIVFVIEEIAYFMTSSDEKLKKRFENALSQLTQLGRSAGFWGVITTQNPVKDVITKDIKANVDTKAGHKTADKTKSRTILDNNLCADIKEKGKYVLQNAGINTLHKSFFIEDKESKTIYYRIKDSNKISLEKTQNNDISIDKGMIEENKTQVEKVEVNNYYNLYNFYINIQGVDGKLPVKKEIIEMTGLSEWKLRTLNEELKKEGKLLNQGNDLIVIQDEFTQRRLRS